MSVWTKDIFVHLLIGRPFEAKGWFANLLAALEAETLFTPQKVGIENAKTADYDAKTATSRARTANRNGEKLLFARTRKLKYDLAAHFLSGFGNHIVFKFAKDAKRSDADCAAIARLGDGLAAGAGADIGILQPITREVEHKDHDRVGVHQPTTFYKAGLLGLAARTWFGPRVCDLAGREALLAAGGTMVELEGGGLRMDLSDEPWTLDLDALKAARAQVEPAVRAAGILASPLGVTGAEPGPSWVPPDMPV